MKWFLSEAKKYRLRDHWRGALSVLIIIACMSSCDLPLQRTDLQRFIETGSSTVILRSFAFRSGSQAIDRVPSGRAVTGSLVIINPKSFDITYSLAWSVDDALFLTPPSTAPIPSDATHLPLSFVLDPTKAEHKTISFALGMYVASLNRHYDGTSFSVICDSPPNPVDRAATVMNSLQKSVLALLLPTMPCDDDLSKLRITWSREGSTTSGSGTFDIPSLSTLPDPNPFSSSYDCYFQAPDCLPGYGYSYSVVLIDRAGQESSPVSATGLSNSFYLNYDGNGATSGTAPASVGYRYDEIVPVALPGNLAKTSYAFSAWSTAADGSGTAYSPGDSLTIGAGDLTFYAQWITNTTVVTIDVGTRALAFSISSATLAAGSTLSVSCADAALAAGGSDWKWYVDGLVASSGSPSFSWVTAGKDVGQHIIGCSFAFDGIGYSGSFRATVAQGALTP